MKNIVIIGSSSGIGNALKEILNPQEYFVYGTYCKNKPITTQSNVKEFYLDVLQENNDLSFLPDTIDGLVYCPGAINLKPFARIKEEDFLNDFKLQVIGAIKIIQACLPKLKLSQQASIVLFSTVAVKMGFNFHSIVSTSKGAIEGLTKSLAAELAPKIRVNCLAPSITNTSLASSFLNTAEKLEANAQKHPLKQIGSPQDIAAMAAYLLSNNSQWITAQIFNIDGGITSIKI